MKIRVRNDGGCDLNETVWEGTLESEDNIILELHFDDGVLEFWNENGVLTIMPQDSRRLANPAHIGYYEKPVMTVSLDCPSRIRLHHRYPKEVEDGDR